MAAVSSVTWQILLQWRHVKTLYRLRVFTKEPIREQKIKLKCMNKNHFKFDTK